MQYNRITSDTKLAEMLKNLDKRISGVETVGTGSMSWVDENGVETIIGELPDGSTGFAPFVGDTTPPPVPTIPQVSITPGVINISWNGVFVDGADKPADFQYVNVLGYRNIGGVLDPAVNLGLLRNSQEFIGVGADVIPVGQVWEFAFSSVDYNRNISEIGAHTAPVAQTSFNTDVLIAEAISSLSDGVSGAQSSADGKSTNYYQPTAPTGNLQIGDTWFDSANGYRVNTWTGSGWQVTQDSTTAQQTADSKGRTYTQDVVPPVSARLPQNLWIDTSAGPGLYVTKYWNGTAWTALKDKDADAAQQTADSKGETIYSSTEPAASKRLSQNLWIDTTGGININKRWDGNAWVVVVDSRIPSTAAAVTAVDGRVTAVSAVADSKGITYTQNTVPPVSARLPQNVWIDTSLGLDKAVTKYWDGAAWTAVSEKAASDAKAVADSKGETIYSSTAPASSKQLPQNLWVDTTGGVNITKRWDTTSGTWVVSADSRIASTAAAVTAVDARVTTVSASVNVVSQNVQDVQTFAATNGVTLTQNTVPSAAFQNPTTIWNDTSLGLNNVVTKYWNGTTWTALADKTATDAQSTANAKGETIYSNTAPAASKQLPQNLWVDTTGGINITKRWDTGTGTWVVAADSRIASTAAAVTAVDSRVSGVSASVSAQFNVVNQNIQNAQTAIGNTGITLTQSTVPSAEFRNATNLWIDISLGTDKAVTKYWNGSAWTAVSEKAANDAQATANAKGETIYSSTTPDASKQLTQNTWVDTTGGINITKRWDGSGWVVAADSRIASTATAVTAVDSRVTGVSAAAGSAISTVDSRVTGVSAAASSEATAKANAAQAAAIAAAAIDATAKADAAKAAADRAAMQTVNKLVNPGFEPDFTNWIPGRAVLDTTTVRSGTNSARIDGGASVGLTPSPSVVPVVEGQKWRVGVWYKTSSDYNGTASNGKLRWGNQSGTWVAEATFLPNKTSWTWIEIERTIATGETGIALSLNTNHTVGKIWFDEVEVRDVTELRALEAAAAQAKTDAIAAAALDATTKANNAQTAAATDATNKVNVVDSKVSSVSAAVSAIDSRVSSVSASVTAVDSKAQTAINNAAAKGVVLTQSVVPAAQYQQSQNLWNDTSLGVNNTVTKYWNGSAWTALADKASTDAATLAGSKSAVIYSTTAPTGTDANPLTLWIDTTNGNNTPMKWVSGTTWASITDKTATDAATAAATAAKATSYSLNPSFDDWTGTVPANYSMWTQNPVKDTTNKRIGAFGMQFVAAAASDNRGIAFSNAIQHAPNLEYFTVEVEFMLTAGTSLQGAGVLLDWSGLTPNRSVWKFSDSVSGTPVLNKWYRLSKTIRRQPNATGTWTAMGGYLMANYSETGTMTAKTMTFDWLNIRPATAEEILSYNAPTQPMVDKIWESARSYINRGTTTDGIQVINNPGPAVVDSATAMGGKALQKTGTGNGWWIDLNAKQAFDPTALYKLTARIRVTTPNNVSGAGRFYLGMTGYAADGVTYVNVSGANSSSSQHYVLNTTSFAQDGTWVDFVGYVRGNSTGNSGGAGTSANPTTMHANVRYIAPLVIMDFSAGNSVMELSHLSMDIVGPEGYQAIIDAANAVTTAAADATSKANQAKTDAISTAAADATSKANAAQQAAITAAAADATAKAEQAEADAAATAAADATAKANQAKADAIAAADAAAQLKADGAEQSAIDAAAADAQAKADAAEAAAIAAAALDATAKAEQAEANAAATAAADATAKADAAEDAAVAAAAITAQAKADAAKAAAISAAATDATTKANNAQAAAISAAAADATAKAEQAEADAAATAAADATSKANAAKQAAIDAAAVTAQLKADGAEQAAIDAAAADAQAKANAAQQAAIDAAALDATAKAEDAEANAAATAAADATAKANQAKQDAIDAAAITAQLKADAAAARAINAQAYTTNASFDDWTSTLPAGFTSWSTGPVKETSIVRRAPYSVRFNVPDATAQHGMQFTSIIAHAPNLEYFTVEMDFYLVSGTLGGAGMILDWNGMTNNRTQISLATEFPSPVTGKWYTLSKVLRRPTNSTGTWTSMGGYLMGQWSGFGTGAAKNIIFDWFDIRPSTAEEILAYSAPADAQTKATQAKNDAIADTTTRLLTKTRTYYQTAKPTGGTYLQGDMWVDSDDGNKVYIYDTTGGFNDFRLAQDANIDKALYSTFPTDFDTAQSNKWLFTKYVKTMSGSPTFLDIAGLSGASSYVNDQTSIVSNIDNNYVGQLRTVVNVVSSKTIAFTATHDDGARIYVDGVSVYSSPIFTTNAAVSFSLSAGWHVIDILWAEQSGGDGITAFSPLLSTQVTNMYAPVSLATVSSIAATASATATSAVTAANGKNKIVFSTSDASGTNYAAGDTWFKKDSVSGNIIGVWEFTTSWQPRVLSDAVFSSISAGKIVADWLDVNGQLKAGSIDATKLNVSMGGNNLVYNSSFEVDSDSNGLADGWAVWTRGLGDAGRVFTNTLVAGHFPGSTFAQKVTSTTVTNTEQSSIQGTQLFMIGEGQKAVLSLYGRASVAGAFSISLRCEDGAGNYKGDANFVANFTTTAQRFSGLVVTPVGTTRAKVTITSPSAITSGHWFEVDGVKAELGDVLSAWSPLTSELLPGTIVGTLIKADALDGKTITGPTIQTEVTASRGIKLTTTELAGYDAAGVKNFSLTTGGALTIKGALTSGSTVTGATVTGSTVQTEATASRGIKLTSTELAGYDAAGVKNFSVLTDGTVSIKGSITSGSTITGATVNASTIQTETTASRGIKLTTTELAGYDASGNKNFSLTTGGTLAIKGAINAGSTITGATLTGAGIETTSTASRGVKIASTGITTYDGSGNMTFKVDASTGIVEAPGLKANSVTANMLASDSVQARHIAIGDFTNLYTSPQHLSETGGVTMSNGSLYTGAEVIPVGLAMNIGARDHVSTEKIAVRPGDQFYIEFSAKKMAGTAALNAGIWVTTMAGTGGTGWSQWSGLNGSMTQIADLGNGWARYKATPYVNAAWTDVSWAQLYLQLSQFTPYDTNWLVADVLWRRRNGGELIVDGAIDGKVITGATVQTIATASRGIKLTSAEFAGYDNSGVKNFSLLSDGTLSLKGAITSGSSITGATVSGGTVTGTIVQTETTASRGIKLTTTELAGYDGAGVKNFSLATDGTLTMRGAIQSGSTITGATLTGAGIETSAIAARGVKLASTGITAYDASGNMTFKVDAATGLVEAPGIKANSISSTMLSATAIDGMTITGPTIQTTVTAQRGIKLTATEFAGYDNSGVKNFSLTSAGALTIKGDITSGSTITGATVTGGTVQSEATASRGIKMTSTELAGYDTAGVKNFSLTSAGALYLIGQIKSGSTIEGATLVAGGGGIQTTATAARGVKVTDTGIKAYDNVGNLTFQVDAATGVIDAPGLRANSVTSTMISATAIDGMTITGPTIQTTQTALRGIKLTSTEFAGYDNSGIKNFSLTSAGALTIKGDITSGSTITGATVTGGTVQSEATASRGIKMTSTELAGYDTVGTKNFSLTSAGALTLIGQIKSGSTIEAATLSAGGGGIQTNPAALRGVKVTDTGIKAYDGSGNLTFQVDGSTGVIDAPGLRANSITSTMVSATAIDGKTITGATIQTETTASRGIKLTSTELAGYDGTGVKNFSLTSAGALTLIGAIKSGSTIEGAQLTGTAGIQTSTVANTGVKLNNAGIKAYDAANNLTFSVDATTGLVKAPGLEANTIKSGMIDTGAVTTNHMTSGTINGGVLTAGSVTALEIASKAITVDKMVITSTDNIVPEADFSAGLSQWGGVTTGWSVDATGSRSSLTALKAVNDATEQTKYSVMAIPVEAGSAFRIACWVKSSVTIPTGGIGLKVRTTTTAGATTITKVVSTAASASAANTWYRLSTMYTMPAGAVKAEFGLYTEASFSTGNVWYDTYTVTRASDGTLVVDGAIDGKTITGALMQTEATALRGLKLDSTGLNAYNTTGVNTFSLSAVTGKAIMTGRILTGAAGEPGLGMIPASESYNGTQCGIFVTTNGNFPGGIGGMWVNDATTGVAERLQLRGHNYGDVEIAGQNLHVRQSAGRVGNFSNWALGDSTNGNSYLPNLQISQTGTGWFRIANAPTTSSSANVIIATNPEGVFYRVSSSIRYKADVQDWDTADRALNLRPRSWVDRKPLDNADPFKRYYGYIAEEVEEHFPEFVVYNDFEEPESVTYDRMPSPATIATLKVLNQKIADLEARLTAAGA